MKIIFINLLSLINILYEVVQICFNSEVHDVFHVFMLRTYIANLITAVNYEILNYREKINANNY